MATEALDRVTALTISVIQSGQVDVKKPEEIRAVVANLLRSLESVDAPLPDDIVHVWKEGRVSYHRNETKVWPKVIELMQFLYEAKGEIHSVAEIKRDFMGGEGYTDHAVYTLIGDARRAMGSDGPAAIRTQSGRGGGYFWNPEFELVVEG